MSWLEDVLDATVEAESPRSYIFWAALSAISAVVKNQVFLDKYYYKVFPNTFVMLIGRSGLRKGFPIWLAKTLVTKIGNNRVISGRNSIQAVISELSKTFTRETGGAPITDSCGFIVSAEFADFLVADPQAMIILTDLFDTHTDGWKNTLKQGIETLKNPLLTFLAASNPSLLKQVIPAHAIKSGFIGRTMLVYEEKKSCINPLTEPPKIPFDLDKLTGRLEEVSKLKGQFKWSMKGKEVFNDWYQEINVGENQDDTGTMERIHDHAAKVAMLLSLSRKDELIINEEDMDDAIKACTGFTHSVRRVTMGTGLSPMSEQTALVIQELMNREEHKISRMKLLQIHHGDFDAYDLDRISDTLQQAHMIVIKRKGSELVYEMTPQAIKRYEMYKEAMKK